MSEQRDKEFVQSAVDACFSDLKGDPWLAQRIMNGAEKEIKVKKKLSFGLVLAIGLVLATVAVAIAATQLGWVDFFGTNRAYGGAGRYECHPAASIPSWPDDVHLQAAAHG